STAAARPPGPEPTTTTSRREIVSMPEGNQRPRRPPSGVAPTRACGKPEARCRANADGAAGPGGHAGPMNTILVGIDGSPAATQALSRAVELAQATGASLAFVCVTRPSAGEDAATFDLRTAELAA